MLRFIAALLVSVAAMFILMPLVLPVLQRLKIGQTIYALGPESHKVKQGTPTMGGLVFAGVTIVLVLTMHGRWYGTSDFGLAIVVFALVSMVVGFVDDYIKVVQKRNLGLVWWQKVVAQVVSGALFSLYCAHSPSIGTQIVIPFFNVEWDLGAWYVPVMTLVILFIVNSANLQDGLDGLLATVSTVGSVGWGALALFGTLSAGSQLFPDASGNYANVILFAVTLSGACTGFLWFNFHPAKVFMGDTGSMFIGGAMVAMAMVLRLPMLLIFIAFTMIVSSLSVILQRVYFKLTHGKRILKMSPLHHHFELSGMTEAQIVAMYAAVTGILSMVAVLSLL
ncbi:MAG: phospho-N-acetylmuramoyl-pentapeptide-transferase [Eubacteriales bacterium]|nr:phospho-N-acetylmuramoyl-pentapeptide-transferase [Eubacteriales bacterium]